MSRSPSRRCWIRARCVVRDAAAHGCVCAQRLGTRTIAARPHGLACVDAIRPVIPAKKDQPRQRNFDREDYRLRNKIERLINRLKQARRIATRYEKRADTYLAMIHIGMILLWLKPFADTAWRG